MAEGAGSGLWALVKHWHDSGGIDGVYGPFAEDESAWIRDNLIGESMCAWTRMEMEKMPASVLIVPRQVPESRYTPGFNTAGTGQHEVLEMLPNGSYLQVLFTSKAKADAIVLLLNAPEE